MHRFFLPSLNISKTTIVLQDKEQVHHLKDVLRLKEKDNVIVFDSQGNEYACRIEKISDKVSLEIKNILPANQEAGIKITVACALPKKAKMDDIIDKLTQLGVYKIIPLITERVIVKLDRKKEEERVERYKRIALSAVKQSQRNTVPVIDRITDIGAILSAKEHFDLKLIPTLEGKKSSLKEIFTRHNPKSVLVLIGPEGDFTPQEVESAKNKGFIPVSLGENVLRVDTAAIAVVSFIKLNAND